MFGDAAGGGCRTARKLPLANYWSQTIGHESFAAALSEAAAEVVIAVATTWSIFFKRLLERRLGVLGIRSDLADQKSGRTRHAPLRIAECFDHQRQMHVVQTVAAKGEGSRQAYRVRRFIFGELTEASDGGLQRVPSDSPQLLGGDETYCRVVMVQRLTQGIAGGRANGPSDRAARRRTTRSSLWSCSTH